MKIAARRTWKRCFAGLFLLASVSFYMSNKDAGANTATATQEANIDLAFDASSRLDILQTSGGWAVRRECLYPQEVVFFIYSRPQDWRRRAAIRDSLLEKRAKGFFNWTGLFIVEQPPEEDTADGAWTDLEAQVMGDVLLIPRAGRGSAPRKLLLGMQWIRQHCARALYVIKVDDDVMIEPFVLFEYLISNVEPRGRLLHCSVMATVTRNRVAPLWSRVSGLKADIPALSLVRSFCVGRAIIMSLPILTDLLRAARQLPPLTRWSEAAYVTGQLAVAAGLGHVDFGSRMAWRESEAYSFVDGGWWIFFHLRGTFALTTLRRALWHQGIWNEALGDDKIRKGLSRRSKPAQYDPEIKYHYDD